MRISSCVAVILYKRQFHVAYKTCHVFSKLSLYKPIARSFHCLKPTNSFCQPFKMEVDGSQDFSSVDQTDVTSGKDPINPPSKKDSAACIEKDIDDLKGSVGEDDLSGGKDTVEMAESVGEEAYTDVNELVGKEDPITGKHAVNVCKDSQGEESAVGMKDSANKKNSDGDKVSVGKTDSAIGGESAANVTDSVSTKNSAGDKASVSKRNSAGDKASVSKRNSAGDKASVSKRNSAGDKASVSKKDSTTKKDFVMENKRKYMEMPLNNKRQLYRCGKGYTTLNKIPVCPDLIYDKISIWRGDITTLEIDAIVNAANESLLGGGGVDGAIHRAAGRFLKDECYGLNGCRTGEAKITAGYDLPSKHVIHTVGPIGLQPKKLENCYKNSLMRLLENGLRSVAFPCISTGIYGYPNHEAVHVALKAVRSFLDKHHDNVDRIIFCIFMDDDYMLYKECVPMYFS